MGQAIITLYGMLVPVQVDHLFEAQNRKEVKEG